MSYNKKIIIIISSFILIIALCFAFLLTPAAFAVKNTLTRLQSQKNFLQELDERNGGLRTLKGDWDESKEDLKKIDERIVIEDEVVDIVMILEDLSERLAVEQNISVVRQSKESDARNIILKNILSGDFNSIMKYIKGAENLKYIINIDSCKFIKQDNGVKADIVLSISAYNP